MVKSVNKVLLRLSEVKKELDKIVDDEPLRKPFKLGELGGWTEALNWVLGDENEVWDYNIVGMVTGTLYDLFLQLCHLHEDDKVSFETLEHKGKRVVEIIRMLGSNEYVSYIQSRIGL